MIASPPTRAQLGALKRARVWRERAKLLREMALSFEGDAREELEDLARHWDEHADWAERTLPEAVRRKAG